MERVHKVILIMLVTKDIDIRVFNHIDPWCGDLAYIAWAIRDSYHRTIMATLGQDVFGRWKIISLASFIDWKVVSTEKQRQVDIDNCQQKSMQVTHEYEIGNQVSAEMTGIYHKREYKKQGSYIITELFTNNTFRFQPEKVNNNINIRRLMPHSKKLANRCPYYQFMTN